jgi:hypothetical protein
MREHRPPVETDPLGAIRKELLTAAWRRKAADDRRRRLLTAMSAAALTLAVVAGGAGALGVDVPVVGDALNAVVARHEQSIREAGGYQGDPRLRESAADMKPGPGNSTETLTFPWGETGKMAAAAAYLNTQDQICVAVVAPRDQVSPMGCTPAPELKRKIESGVAHLAGVLLSESIVVTGYVQPGVGEIQVNGPRGALDVHLTKLWSPPATGGAPLRAFVAVAPSGSINGRVSASDGARLLDLREYSLQARLSDGRTITVRP